MAYDPLSMSFANLNVIRNFTNQWQTNYLRLGFQVACNIAFFHPRRYKANLILETIQTVYRKNVWMRELHPEYGLLAKFLRENECSITMLKPENNSTFKMC